MSQPINLSSAAKNSKWWWWWWRKRAKSLRVEPRHSPNHYSSGGSQNSKIFIQIDNRNNAIELGVPWSLPAN